MFKNKKGSMEMSINSIVILVMAMALLGLGLTFIRGMMGGATSKLGGSIEAADLSEPPTSEKPITMDRSVKIKSGSNVKLKIGYYNTGNQKVTGAVPTVKSCTDLAAGDLTITALSQDVNPGSAVGFEVIMKVKTGVAQGTYGCSLKIGDEEKQFFLEVSS